MASEKTCFKCNVAQPLDAFYAHPRMRDGHLNKCKDCTKRDVAANRATNMDAVRKYDRERASLPHRAALRRAVAARYAAIHPERRRAHVLLGNAVRSGEIKPQPCWVCGDKAEAHHPDYSRPLDVVWLCKLDHEAAHSLVTN